MFGGFWGVGDAVEAPGRRLKRPGGRPLEPPGTAWRRLEPLTWMKRVTSTDPNIYYGLQYMPYLWVSRFGVLGALNWDLRWIMTRALLRDTRSFSYRSWLDPKVFTLRMLYTKHYFGPKAINFGNW